MYDAFSLRNEEGDAPIRSTQGPCSRVSLAKQPPVRKPVGLAAIESQLKSGRGVYREPQFVVSAPVQLATWKFAREMYVDP